MIPWQNRHPESRSGTWDSPTNELAVPPHTKKQSLVGRPHNQLISQARESGVEDGHSADRLEHVVPGRGAVHRMFMDLKIARIASPSSKQPQQSRQSQNILELQYFEGKDLLKSQQLGSEFTVDWKGSSSQGTSTQHTLVGAIVCLLESLRISQQNRAIMREPEGE